MDMIKRGPAIGQPTSRFDLPIVDDPNISPQMRMRKRYLLAGVCVNCAKEKAHPGSRKCWKCLVKQRKGHKPRPTLYGITPEDPRYNEACKRRIEEILVDLRVGGRTSSLIQKFKISGSYIAVLREKFGISKPSRKWKSSFLPELPKEVVKNISRQRVLQLRYNAAGFCSRCGRPAEQKMHSGQMITHKLCKECKPKYIRKPGVKPHTCLGVLVEDREAYEKAMNILDERIINLMRQGQRPCAAARVYDVKLERVYKALERKGLKLTDFTFIRPYHCNSV